MYHRFCLQFVAEGLLFHCCLIPGSGLQIQTDFNKTELDFLKQLEQYASKNLTPKKPRMLHGMHTFQVLCTTYVYVHKYVKAPVLHLSTMHKHMCTQSRVQSLWPH